MSPLTPLGALGPALFPSPDAARQQGAATGSAPVLHQAGNHRRPCPSYRGRGQERRHAHLPAPYRTAAQALVGHGSR